MLRLLLGSAGEAARERWRRALDDGSRVVTVAMLALAAMLFATAFLYQAVAASQGGIVAAAVMAALFAVAAVLAHFLWPRSPRILVRPSTVAETAAVTGEGVAGLASVVGAVRNVRPTHLMALAAMVAFLVASRQPRR